MTESMLERAIEIEGLLRIIRDGNPLPETYKMLTAKATALAEMAEDLERSEGSEKSEVRVQRSEESERTEGSERTEVRGQSSDDSEMAEAGDQRLEESEMTEVGEQRAEDLEQSPTVEIAFLPQEEDTPDVELEEEDLEMSDVRDQRSEVSDQISEVSDQRSEESESSEDLEMAEDSEDEIMLNLDFEEDPIPEPAVEAPKTENEAPKIVKKRESRLKPAFSLNDRFLYSRELFEGNMKMFDSTLEFLEGIEDYSIIEDYFYSELEWDPENRYVASFMDILRPHFKE